MLKVDPGPVLVIVSKSGHQAGLRLVPIPCMPNKK